MLQAAAVELVLVSHCRALSEDDAKQALDAIRKLAEDNFGEPPAVLKTDANIRTKPVSLALGIAMGRLYCENTVAFCPRTATSDADAEIRRLDATIERVKVELEAHEASLIQNGHADEAGVFNAQKLILMDEDIIDEVMDVLGDWGASQF